MQNQIHLSYAETQPKINKVNFKITLQSIRKMANDTDSINLILEDIVD